MLRTTITQKQDQRLSPQQIQFIKLLQVPTLSLEARIKEELEENPALQDLASTANDEAPSDDPYGDEMDASPEQAATNELVDENDPARYEISLEDYIHKLEDRQTDYRTHQPDPTGGEERYEAPIVQLTTMYDSLLHQLALRDLTDRQYRIAEHIIGSIDEDGYFRRSLQAVADELAFRYNLAATEQEVEETLAVIQTLEPAGVGAVDLQQCLLLQLERKPQSPVVSLAETILMDYFEEFTKKHFERILDRTGADPDDFREAYTLITRLNPKPGESETTVKQHYIVPDFILTVQDGQLDIKLNRRNAPELRVSPRYVEMLKSLSDKHKTKRLDSQDQDTLQFVRSKIDSANWFIDAIRQRQATLMRTMMAIADKQRDFFLSEGDETHLRPMVLKDIADEIEMDISTISRVANSKYVQTDFGIFQLKYFFSEGITTDNGEEVSNREVKKILSDLIGAEDKRKPLSDDKLMELLNQKGYNIARRTVAKYREQLNLPVARLRKEL
jgi:RNA polymerase sigma-54 factor